MHLDIDRYAGINSVIHNWDQRFKIASLFTVIVAISFIKNHETALIALICAIILSITSKLPFKFQLHRIMYPILLMTPLFIMLPLTSGGNAVFKWHIITLYSEGLKLALLIFMKTSTIIMFVTITFSTASFSVTAGALNALKIPDKLVNIIVFTYRYFFVFMNDLSQMRRSLALRGFKNRSSIHSIKSNASLMGSLLVRSFEQTENIHHAMILRGYRGCYVCMHEFKHNKKDIILMLTLISIAISVILIDQFITIKGLNL